MISSVSNRGAAVFAVVLCAAFAPESVERANPPLSLPKSMLTGTASPASLHAVTKGWSIDTYGQLPLSFEANVGQVGGRIDEIVTPVRFLARGAGYTLLLTSDEAVLALRNRGARVKSQEPQGETLGTRGSLLVSRHASPVSGLTPDPEPRAPTILRMKLLKANPAARARGLDELPGKSNYFLGNDPARWRTNVTNYAKVTYQAVYRGVDLVYYGNQQRLEYDFVVEPGADPGAITMRIVGKGTYGPPERREQDERLHINAEGDLVVETAAGEVRFHKPVVYQQASAAGPRGPDSESRILKRSIGGRYLLKGKHEVGFEVGTYDRTRPLVIDPVLSYSTYLGGSRSDFGTGIAVDSSGNAYVTGYTFSLDFPTENPSQVYAGSSDAFVTKLNPSGSALVYSTYLGGRGDDLGAAVAVDSSGNAYLTGATDSLDFPTQNAFQSTNAGGTDAFVSKLDPSGALSYSTYLGGSFTDVGQGIAVDGSGSAYVAGSTISVDFPTQNALQSANGGGYDAFITKLSPSGTALVYSTYLGGSADENNPFLSDVNTAGIAVDSVGNAYVAGYTPSNDFPTQNPFQAKNHGFINAFVSKLNASGSALIYSTYLGGHGDDFGHAIAVDNAGNTYVTGSANSSDFPTLSALPLTLPTGDHAFLAKLAANGSLVYATLLGGSRSDFGLGVGVDIGANAFVTGFTNSPDFPLVSPFQSANGGGYDVFVTKFAASGSALAYSTYLGGSRDDHGAAIALDAQGNAFVTGDTLSPNFPITGGAFKTTCGADGNGGSQFSGPTPDAFVAKISPIDAPGAILSSLNLSFANLPVGRTSPAQTVTLRNVGSQPLRLRRILAVPSRDYAQTNNCPASLASATSCSIGVTFTPAAAGTIKGFLILLDNAWPKGVQVSRLTGKGT